MRRWTILIAVVALVLAIPAAASAAPPQVVEDHTDSWSGLDEGLSGHCGFDVWVEGSESVRVTVFSNNEGDETNALVKINGTNTFFTEDGTSATDRYAFSIHEDFVNETASFAGNVWNLHPASGGGIAVNDSGLIVFSESGVVINGPHEAFDSNPGDVICELLSS